MLDFYLLSVELAYRELVVLDLTEVLTDIQKEAIDIIRQCLVTTKEIKRLNQLTELRSHTSTTNLVCSVQLVNNV